MRLSENRNATLVGHHAQNKLLRIPPAIFGMTKEDFDNILAIISFILTMNAEACSVHMKTLGAKS